MLSAESAIASKGGTLATDELHFLVRDHIERTKELINPFLTPTYYRQDSPIVGVTPPSRISLFEFLNAWDVNAWAVLAEERPLVLFHAGTTFALCEFFYALLALPTICADVDSSAEIPDDGRGLKIHTLHTSPFESSWWKSTTKTLYEEDKRNGVLGRTWANYLVRSPNSDVRSRIAHECYITAIRFLFFHELGHIDRGHIDLVGTPEQGFLIGEDSAIGFAKSQLDQLGLMSLEIDADAYALARLLPLLLPRSESAPHGQTWSGTKPGESQAYRMFFFSIGGLILFLDHQQQIKKRSLLRRILEDRSPTHPKPWTRIQFLQVLAVNSVEDAGFPGEPIRAAVRQSLSDLMSIVHVMQGAKIAIDPPNSAEVESLSERLESLQDSLNKCRISTSARYFIHSEIASEEMIRRGEFEAEDPQSLSRQSITLYTNDGEFTIPFLTDNDTVERFLENSAKWEAAGFLDNAYVYARFAEQKDAAKSADRLADLRQRLGSALEALDELQNRKGLTHFLAAEIDGTPYFDEVSKQYSLAEVELRLVATLRPKQALPRLALAQCLYALRRFEEAKEQYEMGGELDDDWASTAIAAGANCDVELGRINAAISGFRRALDLDAENVFSLSNLGICLLRNSRPAEAIGIFEEALKLEGDNSHFWFYLACANEACGDLEKCHSTVTKAISLSREEQEYFRVRAQCSSKLGDHEAAIEDYTIAIGLPGDEYSARYNRALEYSKVGRLDLAVEDLTIVCRSGTRLSNNAASMLSQLSHKNSPPGSDLR